MSRSYAVAKEAGAQSVSGAPFAPPYQDLTFGPITIFGSRPWLIAEAGVNHENDREVARRMVEEAAASGCDAIKFQSYKAATLASRYSPAYWDLELEPTTSQAELFRRWDSFDDDDYRMLARHADECGITFMSTPFDDHFVDVLAPLMPVIKVASADLTNVLLLRRVAPKGKPVILSTGASTYDEIQSALQVLRENGNPPIALLHCVLSYPCDPKDANLRVIRGLAKTFPHVVIGYSDHVPPSADQGCDALLAAWMLGARILEKHFTLDKSKPGNDHYHAMDPDDVRRFRAACDRLTAMMGEEQRRVFGAEEAARKHARRSIVAKQVIPAGTVITEEMVIAKRPGTGIPPAELSKVLGARAAKNIEEDELLEWTALEVGN
jgi:sialic acid synthase SpsE